ncbi:tetratricopeptide repeat protein [Acidocella sp.]|uniref:tetratricopeptide repeat protein n=1 Tax=Acidocella sp. TaxID=50710 RepID=UPI002F3E82CD
MLGEDQLRHECVCKENFSFFLSCVILTALVYEVNKSTKQRNNNTENDGDAAFNLGLMYFWGQGTQVSHSMCAEWTLKAAEEGNLRAAYNMSLLYENGDGIASNDSQAEFWGEKGASRGYDNQYGLSDMYDAGDDDLSSSSGYTSAVAWTKNAAAQGDTLSEYALAQQYDIGTDFPKDEAKAAMFYEAAAKNGLLDAQAHIALAYQDGCGVPQNQVLAYMWYSIQARNHDDPDNDSDLDDMAELSKELTPDQLADAKKMADDFRPD